MTREWWPVSDAETRLVYDVRSAAEQLSVSRSTLMALIASGDLASLKVGARRLVPRSAIEEFINDRLANI